MFPVGVISFVFIPIARGQTLNSVLLILLVWWCLFIPQSNCQELFMLVAVYCVV